MTTKCFFAALVCCFGLGFASEASANSWRVNYDKRANADFQDLNAAMSDERVADGDTLYMDKRCTLSTIQTISKAVTVIGPGYFIGENDADEAYLSSTLNLNVDGIKITGLHTSAIILGGSNIVVERCRVTGGISTKSDATTDNISIRQCYIHNLGIVGNTSSTGWEIANNIIHHYNGSSGTTIYYMISGLTNAIIDHNAIYNRNSGSGSSSTKYISYIFCDVSNSTITNNLLYNYSYSYNPYYSVFKNNYGLSGNNIISHNILSESLSAYPNNKISDNVSQYYADFSSARYLDTNFALSETSIAKGYAEDGSDCGPWSGAYPYVLCGYPLYVPRFESITVPSQPDESGNLKIQMVIKNQNK